MLIFGVSLLTVFCLIGVFLLNIHKWFKGGAKVLLVLACFIPIVNWFIAAYVAYEIYLKVNGK